MAGHKERKEVFTADKNAFASGTSAKGEVSGKKAGQRKAAANQPRDADFKYASGQDGWAQEKTSGHDVHKSGQGETSGHAAHKLGSGKTSGHDVHKLGQGETSGYNVHKPENGAAWQDTRNVAGKTAEQPGQMEKSSQKHRQQRKFQKENSVLTNGENQSGTDCRNQNLSGSDSKGNDFADSRAENVFLQEQNSFVSADGKDKDSGDGFRQDNSGADSNAQKTFADEIAVFAESGSKGTRENAKVHKDGSSGRDVYRQSVKKNLYRRWQSRGHLKKVQGSRDYVARADSGERAEGTGFDEKDTSYGKHREKTDFERDFDVKDTIFTEGVKEKTQGKGTSKKEEKKAEKAAKRTERARAKLPKEKEYSFERVFDEKTGKAKYVLTAVEMEKLFQTDNPVKIMAQKAVRVPAGMMHGKVAEAERENSAVEGAHKSEQKAENAYRFVKRQHRGKAQRRREKLAKLEKKQFRKEVDFRYQKFLEENPELSEKTLKKQMQKRLQKRRIRREYAKAKRAGRAGKGAGQTAAKGADRAAKAVRKSAEFVASHAPVLVGFGALALLLVVLMSSFSSCGALFSEGMSAIMAGSYQSEPKEIDAADLAFSKLELELQKEINSVETDYPGYDEYRYNLDAVGHDPFALISYLSAVHTEFTVADVQGELESLFDEMYALDINPTEETRTRIVTKTGTRTVTKTGTRTVTKTGTRTVTDPDTGEETEEEYEYEEDEEYEYEEEEEYEYEEEEEYTVSILEVTLTVKDLGVVAAGRMDADQKEVYALYNETHGLLQRFYTPLDLYWYNYVSSYYGWRIHPATGAEQLHRGLDIAVPVGTPVLAAMDGTVTTAAYDSYYGNYVVIEDDGYCTKYAHMDTLSVRAGQTVTHGTKIGTMGNTGSSAGSHLHIECLFNGEYFNPLFYFEAGEGTLYGEAQGAGSGGGNAIPPDAYDDASVQALMEEAAKYIGFPYVWGGSSPSTSFDCSGYVCWVFTNSGVHNLPRTTAQGIYDQCTPVPAADAKAGDIIFFTGTYNSAGPVSHVGIYCGNGVMAHAGDPIKYSSINTPYWQSHFYAFGRLN